MRNESVDMTEFTRRIDRGIYDPEEFGAIPWPGEGPHQKKAKTATAKDLVLSPEEKRNNGIRC